MHINNYSAYFHDGGLIDIHHENNIIIISMESAEMSEEDLHDIIPLSEDQTFKGKLHLEKINQITVKGTPMPTPLAMPFDSGDIFHFNIDNNKIYLDISWRNYLPKKNINEFSSITIEANNIWWENIPDLYDPFWSPQNQPTN